MAMMRPGGGPRPGGGGPMGGMGLSLPAEKPRNFKATFKRLMRRLHPERVVIAVVLVLAVDFDQAFAQCLQLGQGDRPTVDPGATG